MNKRIQCTASSDMAAGLWFDYVKWKINRHNYSEDKDVFSCRQFRKAYDTRLMYFVGNVFNLVFRKVVCEG